VPNAASMVDVLTLVGILCRKVALKKCVWQYIWSSSVNKMFQKFKVEDTFIVTKC
jgi:hypothetical protein